MRKERERENKLQNEEPFWHVSDTNYAGQSDDIQDSGFLLPLFLAILYGRNLLAE
jgi:hypothetical protein